MYIGTYAGTIQIFDEATEAKIGDIKLQTGIPRSLTLSQSRIEVLRARFDAREDRDRRHPDPRHALDVHA